MKSIRVKLADLSISIEDPSTIFVTKDDIRSELRTMPKPIKIEIDGDEAILFFDIPDAPENPDVVYSEDMVKDAVLEYVYLKIIDACKDKTDEPIEKGIRLLHHKLSLPEDFFRRLLQEDDWSFIIKLHALIEAACTSLLISHLEQPSLLGIISKLELSNKTIGKMAFLKELDILSEEDRRYVTTLSEWRNKFVHNVQYCNASLFEIITGMNQQEIKSFATGFAHAEANLLNMLKWTVDKNGIQVLEPEIIKAIEKRTDINLSIKRVLVDPRKFIWDGAYSLLSNLFPEELS